MSIFVRQVSGGDAIRLAAGLAPQWSPDGSRLVYVDSAGIATVPYDPDGMAASIGKRNDEEPTLDDHYRRYKPWVYQTEMSEDELPSDVFRRQVFVNTWFERAQADSKYPYDNVMFETDFPHPTCLHPDAVQHALKVLEPWGPEVQRKVLQDNAAALYRIPLPEGPR